MVPTLGPDAVCPSAEAEHSSVAPWLVTKRRGLTLLTCRFFWIHSQPSPCALSFPFSAKCLVVGADVLSRSSWRTCPSCWECCHQSLVVSPSGSVSSAESPSLEITCPKVDHIQRPMKAAIHRIWPFQPTMGNFNSRVPCGVREAVRGLCHVTSLLAQSCFHRSWSQRHPR